MKRKTFFLLLKSRSDFLIYLVLSYCVVIPNYALCFEIGVNTHMKNYNQSVDSVSDSLKKYGFNSIRTDLSWEWVERKPGVFAMETSYAKSKNLIDTFVDEENNAMVILDYGNANYTPTGYPETTEQIDKFVKYVGFVVSQNKGKVKYYEIWNEWVYKTGIRNKKENTVPSVDIYYELVKKTARKIKEIDPNAIIVTGSVNPTNLRDVRWFDELVKMGVLNYIDGVSLHPYSFMHHDVKLRQPTSNYLNLINYENHLRSLNNNKPVSLYITEMGIPTYSGGGGVSRLQAARFIFKYTLLVMSNKNVKGIWWYDYADDGVRKNNKEDNFGFFDNNHNPKTAVYAVNYLNDLTKDSEVTASISNDNTVEIKITKRTKKTEYNVKWKDDYRFKYNNSSNGNIFNSMDSKKYYSASDTPLINGIDFQ